MTSGQATNHAWLCLVGLSQTPSGRFFREISPGSEMVRQNGQNGLFCQKGQMTKIAWFSKIEIYGAISAVPFALGGP